MASRRPSIRPVDRFDAIGDAGLRAALRYVVETAEPISADDAAEVLGVHRSVARGRLERLLQAGLVESRFLRRSGRTGPGAGRPAKLYGPAPERRPLEFPPRRVATLVGSLVDAIPVDGRREALRRAGADYGRELAAAAGVTPEPDRRAGLERICAGLRSLGFAAAVERVQPEAATLSVAGCPLRPLVCDHSDAVELDRGLWAGLVQRGLRGVDETDVGCEADGCCEDGRACRVVLTFAG